MNRQVSQLIRTGRSGWYPAGIVLLGTMLSVSSSPAMAAVWALVDATVSNTASVSLTAQSGKCLGLLPDGSLFTVWYERRTQNSSIVKGARLTPGGVWLLEPDVSLGDSLSVDPSMAVSREGNVHVAWADRRHNNMEIYYRHRLPDGTWEPEARITSNGATSQSPVLAVAASGRVHMVWSDGSTGNLEIHYMHRDPEGTWSPDIILTDHPGASENPAIEIDDVGVLHVVWQDAVLNPSPGETGVNLEIYHQLLDDEGNAIAPLDRVSQALGVSQQPVLSAAPDGSVHVFWSDNRDEASVSGSPFPFAIWYRRWLPDLGFGHEKRFCFSTAQHLNPSVACGLDGTINVVWEDFGHGNSEIYFRQIRPSSGWDLKKTRLTETLGATRGPGLIADDQGNLHLIWSDSGTGEQPSIRHRTGRVNDAKSGDGPDR